jgi:hypothetical protein
MCDGAPRRILRASGYSSYDSRFFHSPVPPFCRERGDTCCENRVAYIALGGLKPLEILDFHSWPKAERLQLLSDIEWLVDVEHEMPVSAATKLQEVIRSNSEVCIRGEETVQNKTVENILRLVCSGSV